MAALNRRLARSRAAEGVLSLGAALLEPPRSAYRNAQAEFSTILPMAAVAVGLLCLVVLIQTSTIAVEAHTLRGLEVRRDGLIQTNLQIEAEIAALQSLRRIDVLARNRLGMIPAQARTYVVVDQVPTADEIPDDRPPSFAPDAPPPDANESLLDDILRSLPIIGEFY